MTDTNLFTWQFLKTFRNSQWQYDRVSCSVNVNTCSGTFKNSKICICCPYTNAENLNWPNLKSKHTVQFFIQFFVIMVGKASAEVCKM